MTTTHEALRFGCSGNSAAREPKDGEFYYRIELPDGREALIIAESVTVEHRALMWPAPMAIPPWFWPRGRGARPTCARHCSLMTLGRF
jgi:hypothetical protein